LDESACRRIVEANIRRLMRALGVQHWNVIVAYEPAAGDHRPCDGYRAAARADINPPYNSVVITIDPALADTEAEVLERLRHELEHVVQAPFVVYRKLMRSHLRTEAERERERDLWEYCTEQGVLGLDRMWDGVRELADEANRRDAAKARKRKR
jgi:hypothetical protein